MIYYFYHLTAIFYFIIPRECFFIAYIACNILSSIFIIKCIPRELSFNDNAPYSYVPFVSMAIQGCISDAITTVGCYSQHECDRWVILYGSLHVAANNVKTHVASRALLNPTTTSATTVSGYNRCYFFLSPGCPL